VFWYSFPAVLLQRFYLSWVSRGSQLPIISQANTLLSSFAVVPATFKGLVDRTNHRFVVTDKGKSHGGHLVHWRPLTFFVAYGLIIGGAMAYRLSSAGGSTLHGTFKYVAVLWTLSNFLVLLVSALTCVEAPRRRGEYRYPADEPAVVRGADGSSVGRVLDLSTSGALIQTTLPDLIAGQTPLSVSVEGVGLVPARVVRSAGRQRWGLAFESSDEQRRALIRKIFCSERYVRPPDEGSAVVVIGSLLKKVFT
jgi:cellulose synthase (UDP-forming)